MRMSRRRSASDRTANQDYSCSEEKPRGRFDQAASLEERVESSTFKIQPGFRSWDRQRREAQPFRSEGDGFLPLSRLRSAVLRGQVKPHSNDVRERKMTLKFTVGRLAAPGLHLASGIFGLTAESGSIEIGRLRSRK